MTCPRRRRETMGRAASSFPSCLHPHRDPPGGGCAGCRNCSAGRQQRPHRPSYSTLGAWCSRLSCGGGDTTAWWACRQAVVTLSSYLLLLLLLARLATTTTTRA